MSGRNEEFTDFVVATRDRLLRTAYLICGEWARAEDVTQVALSKVFAAWSRIQENPEAYARTVVARAAVDASRRPWRREVHTDAVPQVVRSTTSNADDRLTLGAAVRRLPPRQRQVVVLRHYWGLSIAETAAELGIASGAVKVHASRALTRLNDLLSEAQEPPDDRARTVAYTVGHGHPKGRRHA